MNERLRKLRKMFDMTQQEFADKIGVKRNTIANYEGGRNEPIDAVISLICNTYWDGERVNEEWLRTGKGEMFLPRTRNQAITDFAADLITEPESFKTKLIEGLAKLDESDWEDIERIIMKMVANKKG